MTTRRTLRNEPCPCGSGRKYKHCCMRKRESLSGAIPQHRPVPGDGAALHTLPNPTKQVRPRPKPITRVSIGYVIQDAGGKAEVGFNYILGTPIIMADCNVLPVEYLKPGNRFRLEDGGVATVTSIDQPKVWEPPSQERDADGHFPRRIIGTVEYTGYFPTMDLCVGGEVIETTPGHRGIRPDRHHIFPEAFRDFFRARGVNIDRYTLPLDSMQGVHGALHFGGGPGKGGGWWNDAIMRQIFVAEAALPAGQQLSRREILRIGAEVRRLAELQHVKVVHYRG